MKEESSGPRRSLKKHPHQKSNLNRGKPATKISRVLSYFLQDHSLNRFDAERLGDHCLHSTISKLSNSYGITFTRQSERVSNHWGHPCMVTRYRLPLSQYNNASKVLKMLCSSAGQLREVAV